MIRLALVALIGLGPVEKGRWWQDKPGVRATKKMIGSRKGFEILCICKSAMLNA